MEKLTEIYLIDQTPATKKNSTISSNKEICIGFPQGTVVGPILFITYINSLLSSETGELPISCADSVLESFNNHSKNFCFSVLQGDFSIKAISYYRYRQIQCSCIQHLRLLPFTTNFR